MFYYHLATGTPAGPKNVALPISSLKPGTKLATMLTSPTTRQAYTLTVASSTASPVKLAVVSVGSVANIVRPDIKAGAGVAHGIDNILLPIKL